MSAEAKTKLVPIAFMTSNFGRLTVATLNPKDVCVMAKPYAALDSDLVTTETSVLAQKPVLGGITEQVLLSVRTPRLEAMQRDQIRDLRLANDAAQARIDNLTAELRVVNGRTSPPPNSNNASAVTILGMGAIPVINAGSSFKVGWEWCAWCTCTIFPSQTLSSFCVCVCVCVRARVMCAFVPPLLRLRELLPLLSP